MRTLLCGAVAVCLPLLVAGSARADDHAEGLKLVDKAIKAVGDEAKLGKLPAGTFKAKGTAEEGGMEIAVAMEGSWTAGDKARLEMEITVMGQTMKGVIVLNGDKAWDKFQDKVEDAPAGVAELLKAELYALRLAQTLTALKDKDVKLSPLGEVKVNDKPALGLKVTCKDRPDVDLYLDKESMLPVKLELRVKEPDGQERPHEFHFADYKEVGGFRQFTKLVFKRDGKKMIEMEVSDVKREEKLDDGLFDKP